MWQFIVAIYLSIFIHELGHYITIRMFGIKVHEFVVGTSYKLIKFNFRETKFSIGINPFGGGYVANEHKDFEKLSLLKKLIIISAGIILNFVCFIIGLTIYLVQKNVNLNSIWLSFITVIQNLPTIFNGLWEAIKKENISLLISPDKGADGVARDNIEMFNTVEHIVGGFWLLFAVINLLGFILNSLPFFESDGYKALKYTTKLIFPRLNYQSKIIVGIKKIIQHFKMIGIASFIISTVWSMKIKYNLGWIEAILISLLLLTIIVNIVIFMQNRKNKDLSH
ncbi:site-2 protease family protein [Paenibacillus sp. BC26]|uniref:site-2 protease family protein n=1 Tax=Paenibacillus sp. BC26 TaxID=1881032 RepID=UPI0008EA4AFD|nr:site-2 protease family protein [Paenibacillus sp. BC26]SFS70242.1 Peptidase family M50 [Paenibacillus sp. BC26]